MYSITILLSRLILGSDFIAISFKFVLLIIFTLWGMRLTIKRKIGSLAAVEIRSYMRLISGLILCNLPMLAGFQLLLSINPTLNWLQFLKYFAANIGIYFGIGMFVVAPIGYIIDGGRAIRVITDRYKPSLQLGIDITKEQGKTAQLIPRAVAIAYALLFLLAVLIVLNNLLGGRYTKSE
jgi:hypothetical protein